VARDQTEADYEYGKLILERRRLNKVISEASAGAAEEGFSAETRAEWARTLEQYQLKLEVVEVRIREVEPQAKIDQAKRHARDLEEAAEYKRKQQKMKF
jgi:hypothetical protein